MNQPDEFTLLLVDDEPSVLRALTRTLRHEDYRILTATRPEEALEILDRETVDLVMADHRMPEMTGVEFLTEVRSRWPWILRVMLTGYSSPGTAIDAINEVEVHRFLTKPWDNQQLRAVLAAARDTVELITSGNRKRPSRSRQGYAALNELEQAYPGISRLDTDADGTILLSPDVA